MSPPVTVVVQPSQTTVVVMPPVPVSVLPAGSGLQGVPGPQGAPGGTTAPFVQASPGQVWTCPHNLDRFPSVTVVDTLGQVVTPDIHYIDNNIVRITHGSAIAGTVYFN